ncbi:RTA1-like protein [Collybia nuda]|uniref:RTA1-like protein n=1 Tax=Collybia nuda TaxID=64659 RepID=A0A9P5YA17_9AGAR|nr:RTA1-like protein [Collybia nuda]
MSGLNGTNPSLNDASLSSTYGYIPTESIAILFIVLFSISTILHVGQAVFSRMWWLLPTAGLCGVMEILGWSARLWSSISPLMNTPFIIQITSTILAPTPLVAANFVILGRIIVSLGPAYSRLSPKWYTIVFCSCDVISLVVQSVGGAMASIASGNNEDPTPGGNIMLGGIIFQMATITIYVICAIEFFVRYFKRRPVRSVPLNAADGKESSIRGYMDKRLKIMSIGLSFSTVCLFIRSIYRTIELVDGWNGKIITTQVYFNVLDGAMIVLAMYTLNFVHPGVFLKSSGMSERDSSDEFLAMKAAKAYGHSNDSTA